ncbi:MAG: hypothetical protein BWX80_03796 [Candidatus Hydrogenedentes bacterium ADurb.Bin101]|nr:MAG: hypothetical protein BWX80_03796 [Candidatus Hydrogenedentes bacterium ADurb.Bin101]
MAVIGILEFVDKQIANPPGDTVSHCRFAAQQVQGLIDDIFKIQHGTPLSKLPVGPHDLITDLNEVAGHLRGFLFERFVPFREQALLLKEVFGFLQRVL